MRNEAKDKYHVYDWNGFRQATATTEGKGRKLARMIADRTGIDTQLCFKRYRFARIIRFRSKNYRLVSRRVLLLNGQQAIG